VIDPFMGRSTLVDTPVARARRAFLWRPFVSTATISVSYSLVIHASEAPLT
jgi:hypothetical protein